MLEMIDVNIDNVVAFRCGGKISEAEMTMVLSAVKEKIDVHKEVYLYEEVISVGGAELEAIIEKIKFLYNVGISKITRIAVVTDKKWMQRIVDLEDKLFRKIDMKCFNPEDKENAFAFLAEK